MEDFKSQPSTRAKSAPRLARLLEKNRSYRGYDNSFVVRADQLRRIIDVNTKIPSARNQQLLRFRPVLSDEAHKVLPHIRLGGALRDMHLPFEGHEPRAFVVICSAAKENDHYVYIDLGISAQSMLLQATEIGLNGICIGAFDRPAVKAALGVELEPLLVVAIGKGDEKIELTTISPEESHDYWRDAQGRHFVPKLSTEDIIIK